MGQFRSSLRRRLLRGGTFWLSVALAGVVAWSWVKSYWWADTLECVRWRWECRVGDNRGRIHLVWRDADNIRSPEVRWYRTEPWNSNIPGRWGGFALYRWTDDHGRTLFIPHWAPLVLCLAVACWAGRPWRRRRTGRGFEVLAPAKASP